MALVAMLGSASLVGATVSSTGQPNVSITQDASNNQLDPFEAARAKAKAESERRQRIASGRDNANRELYNDYIRRSWEWHLFSTKLIFFLVVFIVFFGIFISWLQFRHDIARSAGKSKNDEHDYDVTASLQNISIKSKTIGAVILLASAGFFLMYLIHVYPMRLVQAG